MRFLLLGDGAREHAMAEALLKSGEEVYACMSRPNPGIMSLAAKHWTGNLANPKKILEKAREWGIEQCVVGPEEPLTAGVTDLLEKEGIVCANPSQAASRIGTDREFFRGLVQKHECAGRVAYQVFDNEKDAAEFIDVFGKPVAVKPLTGSNPKVKLVCDLPGQLKDLDSAKKYSKQVIKSTGKVVIEEYLFGGEFTIQAFVDHEYVAATPAVKNYRFSKDGDKGTLTQGMGSYCAGKLLPFMEETDYTAAVQALQDIVNALAEEQAHYKGAITGDFMLTKEGPKLIEVRPMLGDPQAMNLLPILTTSFGEICEAINEGELKNLDLLYDGASTVCSYVAPEGYPTKPGKGKISLPRDPIATMYYNAVKHEASGYKMTGGRAVAFVGKAATLEEAKQQVVDSIKKTKGKIIWRKDVGAPEEINKSVEKMNELRGKEQTPEEEPE